jgi:hypothetical protein
MVDLERLLKRLIQYVTGKLQIHSNYRALRELALNVSPADLKLQLDHDRVIAYGIIMEIGLSRGIVTLVSFISGEASLYYSTGGGTIGGHGHDTVRKAARRFVECAQTFLRPWGGSWPLLDRMSKVADLRLPGKGQTHFYVLANRGVYGSSELLTDDLADSKSELSPLFSAGNDVISAFEAEELVAEFERLSSRVKMRGQSTSA